MKIFLFVLLMFPMAHASILIEENNQTLKKPVIEKVPLENSSSSMASIKADWVGYRNFSELKSHRRVGVGGQIAGASGLLGSQIELNFTSFNAFTVGFGGSDTFRSFQFGWKRPFSGTLFVPYFSLGFAHWMSQGSQHEITKTTPAFLYSQLLDEEQRRSGKFTKDFLIPGFGLQYFQLFGSAVGSSVYAEVDLMTDVVRVIVVPTGSLGFLYYF